METHHKIALKADSFSLAQLAKNWFWYLIFGIASVILGALAIVYSFSATIFSVVYLGFLLIVVGIMEAFHSFKLNRWGNFFLHLFLGILYTVGGFLILTNPALNALTLTLFISLFFIISGIARSVFALIVETPHRGWQLLNGIITLILGILILKQWPISGLWVIGTFVGIDLLFTGWTWIILSLKARNIKNEIE